MEDHSFDELTKRLARPISRRTVLKAAAASVVGVILVKSGSEEALAVDPHCSGLGGKCNPGHRCCDGLVCVPTGPGANGTCGCPPNTVNKTGTCVCENTGQPPCGFKSDGTAVCCTTCQACKQSAAGPTCASTCPTCPPNATCQPIPGSTGCQCTCAGGFTPCPDINGNLASCCVASCQTCTASGTCQDTCLTTVACRTCDTTPTSPTFGTCVNACPGPTQFCCSASPAGNVCCQNTAADGSPCSCETTAEGGAFCGRLPTATSQPCARTSDCPSGYACVTDVGPRVCVPPCS